MLQLQRDFQPGKSMLTIEVMQFLSDWLRGHIGGIRPEVCAVRDRKGCRYNVYSITSSRSLASTCWPGLHQQLLTLPPTGA